MKQNRVPLSKPIPVKLPPAVLERLDAVSKRMGEPRSTVMRIALRVGLDGLEKALEVSPATVTQALQSGQSSSAADTERKVTEAFRKDLARDQEKRGVRLKGKQ